jgi:demethylmenaquinone methyltransferase/2-methoxy-6-polyprenyl-1,4-benzoquinol methylase
MIPLIGGMLTGDRGAYEFLVRSIRTFAEPAQVTGIMARAGFTRVLWRAIDLGVAVLYAGYADSTE